jgi:ribosome-binding protein aMBF1 (putative translation factor)
MQLPDRATLRAAAQKRLERPSDRILLGQVPEEGGYTPTEIKALFEEALLERRVGEALQEARKSRNVSGAELARRIGVSAMRISQLERVSGNVEVQTLARVAEALGFQLTLTLTPKEGGKPITARGD